jgi:hypothetical protein
VDAPYGKGFLVGMAVIDCFHMSGLFCAALWIPLALMEIRR